MCLIYSMKTVAPPSGQLGRKVSWWRSGEKSSRGQKGEGRWESLPCLWGRKVLQKGEEGLVSLFWKDKEAENINPAHGQEVKETGEVGETGPSWAKKKNNPIFFCPPLTWSVEVLWWSGQRGGVAMATVHCINSKGAMACGFWDVLLPIKALLSKRDQRCVKKKIKKKCKTSFNFTSGPNIQCNLLCWSGVFTSVVSDTAPGD